MTGTSIIIPTYNGLELLLHCLSSIKRNTEPPYEVIVVDNGSADGTPLRTRTEPVTLVSLPRNSGFPAACNMGIKAASGDRLLLLNNDVLVGPGWLERMTACLERDPRNGVVGPMTNFASGRQQLDRPYTSLDQEAEWHARECGGQSEEVDRIVGLCMLFRRELTDTIGCFDERFSPGHFEDDDFCHRARLAGFHCLIARDAFVFHHGSASFGRTPQLQQELIRRNRQLFIEKWGFDPVRDDGARGAREEAVP